MVPYSFRLLLVHEFLLSAILRQAAALGSACSTPKTSVPLVQPFNANRTNSSEHNKPHLPTPNISTTQQTHDQLVVVAPKGWTEWLWTHSLD